MTTAAPEQTRLMNILLADDGSSDSQAAVRLIAELPHARAASITALRVFPPTQTAEHVALEQALERTRNLLTSRHMHAKAELLLGYPAEKILEYADEHHPDLIVMGAKGMRNTAGFALGGVAMHIVEDGRFPVLVVRSPYEGLRRVLVATDGSACGQLACNYLGRFPLPEQCSVDFMHVLPPPPPEYLVEPFAGGVGFAVPVVPPEVEKAEEEREKADGAALLEAAAACLQGHPGQLVLARGDAATEIIAYAREQKADMIVCGSRGLGAVRSWLLGSVSRKLVYHAPCAVLVARCMQQP